MSKRIQVLLFVVSLSAVVGCGGGSSNSKNNGGGQQHSVTFTSPIAGPTINLGQSVNLTVSASGGVKWGLHNGNGLGAPPGKLVNKTGTSATYEAPPLPNPPPFCNVQIAPPNPVQAVITATSVTDSGQSASLTVQIVQSPPCVATAPQVVLFNPSQGNQVFNTCPPAGTAIPYVPTSNPQLFQVGVYNQVVVYDGGGQVVPVSFPYGVAPFTWKKFGSLPVGVNLITQTDTSNVALAGTPVSPGCSSFTLTITDATGMTANETFFLLVLPQPLKAQVPAVPTTYVDKSTNTGIPYPPVALNVTGGISPYVWNYDPNPVGQPNFPLGLCLISAGSTVPAGCATSPPPASSSVGVISGTPSPANLVGGLTTQYPVQLQVNDSQQPYPAVALVDPTMTVDFQQSFCTPAPSILPHPGVNGGVVGGGSVSGNLYLQGNIGFLLHGFDADGPVVIAGSVNLSSDGSGTIAGGEMDVTRRDGSQKLTVVPTGSSFTAGVAESSTFSYNRGCMTLADSSGGKTTLAFSAGSCSNHYTENGVVTTSDNACGMKQNSQQQNIAAGFFTTGRVIEFDDNTGKGTRATGILRLQDPSSFSGGLSGPYAFGLSGGSTSGHYGAAGSFRASSSSFSSVAADTDDAGALGTQLTGGSGTYGSVDANGRATGTLTVGGTSFGLALYMVSKNEVMLATTDSLSAGHPIAGGEAITTAGSFSSASVQNSHMFHLGGLALGCTVLPSGCPDVGVGVLSFDGIGSFTGTLSENQSGTLGTSSLSGAYSVDPSTGRTVFSAPVIGQNLGPHPFVAYVVPSPANLTRTSCSIPASCVTGFLVGTDNTAQDGVLEFQTSVNGPPPPFTSRFLVGDFVYGDDESLNSLGPNFEGNVNTFPSASSLTTGSFNGQVQDRSFGDPNYCSQPGCALLMPNESLGGSYVVNPNGTGSFGGATAAVTNGRVVFYIDQSPLNLYPTVVVGEQ